MTANATRRSRTRQPRVVFDERERLALLGARGVIDAITCSTGPRMGFIREALDALIRGDARDAVMSLSALADHAATQAAHEKKAQP